MTNKGPLVRNWLRVYKCEIANVHSVTIAERHVSFAAKFTPTMKCILEQNVPKRSCAMSCEIKT